MLIKSGFACVIPNAHLHFYITTLYKIHQWNTPWPIKSIDLLPIINLMREFLQRLVLNRKKNAVHKC